MLFFLLFLRRNDFPRNVFAGHTKASFHMLFRCIRRACRAFFRRLRPRWAHHLFEAPTTWRTRIHRVRNQFASVSAEVVSAASTPCTDTRKGFLQPARNIFTEGERIEERYDGFFVTVSNEIAWSNEPSGTGPSSKNSVPFRDPTSIMLQLLQYYANSKVIFK